jgi:hypothetical protein
MANEKGGCYNDCYAAKSSKLYGYDFSKTVLREFEDRYHVAETIRRINRIRLDFVRIGCSGDPSENWEHALKIIRQIEFCSKEIVIITRHWTILTDEQLQYLSTINLCINTSVSALDKPEIMERCLQQYNRIKPFLKSVLRIVSCDFNLENSRGHYLAKIQADLFRNESTLDTVLRLSPNNRFIKDGIVNVKRISFLGKKQWASKHNPKTYVGKCSSCQEMCGLNIKSQNAYPLKHGIVKQMKLEEYAHEQDLIK